MIKYQISENKTIELEKMDDNVQLYDRDGRLGEIPSKVIRVKLVLRNKSESVSYVEKHCSLAADLFDFLASNGFFGDGDASR
jgi:hypothetical protein